MLTRSRLGLHIIQPTSFIVREIERAAMAGAPLRMVKCVDFPGLIQEVLRVSPSTLVMWRATALDNPDGGEYTNDQDFDALAERLLLHHLIGLGDYTRFVSRIILEVLNEPDPPTSEGYRNLGRLMIILMRKATERGLTIAAPALNFGTPSTWDKLDAFISTGVFQVAHDLGHWITFHEGVEPGWEIDHAWGGVIPGFPFHLPAASPYNLRYRYAVEAARRRGDATPNIAITEWYSGSKAPAEDVVAAVDWYDQRVREDQYLGAFMLFTHGANGRWKDSDRDYDPVLHDLIDYAIVQGTEEEVPMSSIFIQSNTPESLDAAIRAMQREGFTERRRGTTEWAELDDSPPPVPPFYTRLLVGVHLRVVRQGGLMVYHDSGLMNAWNRGYVAQGSTSMVLALPYDSEKDIKPPVGVLCVLKPGISSSFPTGLWVVGMGNDGFPNVEVV